jgi:hypothetical protein
VWRLNRDRSWTVLADFSKFLAENPTAAPPDDDFEPDGGVYSMLRVGRRLFVVEANHAELDRVGIRSGRIRRILDISATKGHITPTALAYRGGHLYVGNLTRSRSSGARPRSSGSPWTAATSGWWPPG